MTCDSIAYLSHEGLMAAVVGAEPSGAAKGTAGGQPGVGTARRASRVSTRLRWERRSLSSSGWPGYSQRMGLEAVDVRAVRAQLKELDQKVQELRRLL